VRGADNRLRAGLRLAGVGIHLLAGVATTAFVFPFCATPRRLRLRQRWSQRLLRLLGVRLRARGVRPPPGRLLVANHLSWLDIYVINALVPAAFVSKAEVRDWPLIGWLAARSDTLFMARGNGRAARETADRMATLLRAGEMPLVVFPEGTTGDGSRVLPFRAALLQAALAAGSPLQPLAIAYADPDGAPSQAARYDGEVTLWQSLRRLAAAPATVARIQVLPEIDGAAGDRRRLAALARAAIAAQLPAMGGAYTETEPASAPGAGPPAEATSR
jgi:1-acyl-sn-glycerol-3-phosphate acyltransferase